MTRVLTLCLFLGITQGVAAQLCEAEGKRLCDAHEWEGRAREAWSRWRAPFWHGTRVMDTNSHANYHLGFRCCETVEPKKPLLLRK
jgi:hypothetical protein